MKPAYDYICHDCAEIFETNHSMQFAGVVQCPVCSSGRTRKIVLSSPALSIWFKDARSSTSCESLRPKFRGAIHRKPRERPEVTQATAASLGGQ